MTNAPDELESLKAISARLGYRFERVETETEIIERMIRTDGSVAVTATKRKANA